jgi:hypothetical protein
MLTSVFTKPAAALFLRLAEGWALCPARRTLTHVYRFGDPPPITHVDATHYFFRDGEWSSSELWKLHAQLLVARLAPSDEVLTLTLDDTTHHKTGPCIDGARTCRDAVRSTRKKVVHCWALQYVPLCLLVHPPWGGEPLSIPLAIRLNRKMPDGKTPVTLLDHAEAMLRELAEWLPDKRFRLVADGAYAPLAGRDLPRTEIISRMRSDAAIFDLPPKRRRRGQRGRPPTKGKRLPSPKAMAARVRNWRRVQTTERGVKRERLVFRRQVLWAHVSKKPVWLVISRDPSGREKDDFFFTTEKALSGAEVVSLFSDRWSVEDTFRNVKQFLGAEEPQSWKRAGPERAGAFSYLMYGAVWLERIGRQGQEVAHLDRPWYKEKKAVSFQDALADTRTRLWEERIKGIFASEGDMMKIQKTLIEAVSWAS